jgi:hypothetical protein
MTILAFGSNQFYNLRENRRSKSSHWIPALRHREASCVAASIASAQNVCEALVTLLVQPRVHETQSWFISCDKRIVNKTKDAINGDEAEVPEITASVEFQKYWKYRPWAETSG